MTLKLKRTPGLYLVGFMAAGKTTVGAALAEELGWPFIDVDKVVEAQEGRAVGAIFAERGEAAFRDLESATIRHQVHRIEAGHPCVVALGGGAFVQPRNWELIINNGITIWLDCSMETVCRRLSDDTTRPLAQDRAGLSRLYGERRPLYSRADFRVEVDSDRVADTVRKILVLPIF